MGLGRPVRGRIGSWTGIAILWRNGTGLEMHLVIHRGRVVVGAGSGRGGSRGAGLGWLLGRCRDMIHGRETLMTCTTGAILLSTILILGSCW